MPDWLDYIQPELLFLVPLLYGLGELIKMVPKIKNWLIPFILMGVSILLATLHTSLALPFSYRAVVTGVTQGMVIALFTVGVNQAVKQISQKNKPALSEAPEHASEVSGNNTDSTSQAAEAANLKTDEKK